MVARNALKLTVSIVVASTIHGVGGQSRFRRRQQPSQQQQEQLRVLQERRLPQFAGEWEKIPDLPLEGWLAESLGTGVGNDLIITGGFYNSFGKGLRQTFSLDISRYGREDYDPATDPNPPAWIEKDLNPINFWTHAGHAVRGNDKMYLCGGYFKQNPGPEMDECYLFEKSKGSYTRIASLPQGRGGGGMIYIESMNALLFTLGAIRPDGLKSTEDKNSTWMMNLDNVNADSTGGEWIGMTPSPYLGNHVAALSAYDCEGRLRYYFLSGQEEEFETTKPIGLMYEYLPETDEYVRRMDLPEATSHITSATVPYGCGFITIGGRPSVSRSDRIYYYDIDYDDWTYMGKYPMNVTTAICGLRNDAVTCTSGYTISGWTRKLSFPAASTDEPTLSPSIPPTPSPSIPPTPPPSIPPTPPPSIPPTPPPTIPPTPPPSIPPTPSPTSQPTSMPTTNEPTPLPTLGPTIEKHPDVVEVVSFTRIYKPNPFWFDSYSVDDRCYCASNFDNGIGSVIVQTPYGNMTVMEVCMLIGVGPGSEGRPLYNDVQCGNGPSSSTDEKRCPGRVDTVLEGCGHIGPKWNFDYVTISFGEAGGDDTVRLGEPSFFNAGQPVPAGTYQIQYVDGCMVYHDGPRQEWTINGSDDLWTVGWWLVTDDAIPDSLGNVKLPGTKGFTYPTGAYESFEECVDANLAAAALGPPLTYVLESERPLGVFLTDSMYDDNVPGPNGRSPKWNLTLLSSSSF